MPPSADGVAMSPTSRSSLLLFVALCSLLVLGCGRPMRVGTSSAALIQPLSEESRAETGTLVARVYGNPREIVYFVNGVRIDPETDIEWWRDAEIRLDLRPGYYQVEATYLARGFAPDVAEYRITTQYPVQVAAGRETFIEATIEKDWRGVPDKQRVFFHLVEPAGSSAAPAAPAETETAAEDQPSESPDAPPDAADHLVVHGEPSGSDSYIRIESAGPQPRSSGRADDIVIRGDAASVAPVPEASFDLPATSTPEAATAAGEAAVTIEPLVPSATRELLVGVVLQSTPPGASVRIDGQLVGSTPLRVQIDPRYDHVIEFQRDGCGDFVRLLSTSGWQDGRSSAIQADLVCD